MQIKRREFLMLTATFGGGCSSIEDVGVSSSRGQRTVDAGPAGGYAAEGVYTAFREQAFFIVRQGEKLFALSAICTHKKCKLNAEPDRSFYCPCHGSIFDAKGHVTEGPAKRDLPVYTTFVNENGQLLVTVQSPPH